MMRLAFPVAMRSLLLKLSSALMAASLTGCTQAPVTATPTTSATVAAPAKPDPSSFDLDKKKLRAQAGAERLIQKIESSRFRYFRMLARPFETALARPSAGRALRCR